MGDTIAIERVDHIGIRVRHLERALAFYRVLGFDLAHRAKGDDVAIVREAQKADEGESKKNVNGRIEKMLYGA